MSKIDLSNITAENIHTLCSESMVSHFFMCSQGEQERTENFSLVMDKAREFGTTDEVFNLYQQSAVLYEVPELWEKPKPFGKKVKLADFPLSCLPLAARNFLKETSDNIQVSYDMAVLPLLSVLSLCVQGKAIIKNPGGGNTETLNLYTLTINVIRRTQQAVALDNPLITFGLMAQTEPFEKAMSNPQFSGRGLVHRFLYAFPESKTGKRTFVSTQVSDKAKHDYNNLIYKLLSIKPSSEIPVILCDKEAFNIFKNYHDSIEDNLKDGGTFEYMREWANKQLGRALKIAGIFHLCEHEPQEPLSGQTALNAVRAAMWAENQALKAFNEIGGNDEEKSAKYVLNRIKKSGSLELSKREILRLCQKYKSVDELEEPLNILEDFGYIRFIVSEQRSKGRPSEKYKINPLILI